jgi:hypothetical protein
MWNDDSEFPSVEAKEADDIEQEIPEGDWEWLEGWQQETANSRPEGLA